MDLARLTRQVLHNCDVSDARYAGIYSVCGLAMRLRDLYKWDQRLPPWEEHEAAAVLDWIGQREELWESLADAEFEPLTIGPAEFEPFDSLAINAVLTAHGLFYGAGYAHSLKPTFFLANIEERQTLRDKTIWRLGQELARDLLTLPAFVQDDQVVLRTEAARMFLWDEIAYIPNSGRAALAFALTACCNLADTNAEGIRRHLDAIMKVQQTTYIRHELSELEEQVFDRAMWRQMLTDFPHTVVELLIRTLKDMLADTGPQGPLHHFSAHRNKAGLGFYMAFSGGLVPPLFGELKASFNTFMQRGNWDEIDRAISAVYHKAAVYAQEVMAIYAAGSQKQDLAWAQKAIEETLHARGLPKKNS
ncbi:MAG: Sfum_1244 family protein [Desulfatitalea sp.]